MHASPLGSPVWPKTCNVGPGPRLKTPYLALRGARARCRGQGGGNPTPRPTSAYIGGLRENRGSGEQKERAGHEARLGLVSEISVDRLRSSLAVRSSCCPQSSRSSNPIREDPTFKALVGAVRNSDLCTGEFVGKQARTAKA